jgi:hypothetical protein
LAPNLAAGDPEPSLSEVCFAGGTVFKKIVLCLGIEIAAMMGAPLRPEDFEDLLKSGRSVRIESVYREEDRDEQDGE